jgi:hypothetical protein
MCVDCVLASPRIAQVDPDDGPPSEVVLSHSSCRPNMLTYTSFPSRKNTQFHLVVATTSLFPTFYIRMAAHFEGEILYS